MDYINELLSKANKRQLALIGLLIIILALPLTLILVRQSQDTRSRAAAPDNLEAEDGNLTSTGVSIQSASDASGGKFALFNKPTNTPTFTPTNTPTNTPSPTPVKCTLEAKICIDGTSVGRNPANSCNFDPCPTVTAYIESSGKVMIEAERTNSRRASVKSTGPSTYNWVTRSNGTYSDGSAIKFVRAEPNDDLDPYFYPGHQNSAIATYYINFSQTGTYWLYARAYGPDAKSDSAHFELDFHDNDTQTMRFYNLTEGNVVWKWTNVNNVRLDGIRARIVVNNPGLHKFNLFMREDGARIDRIYLNKDKSWTAGPNNTNKGPVESNRGQFPGEWAYQP